MLTVFCLCLLLQPMVAKIEPETATATYSIEAVQGGIAKLPCDIVPSVPKDRLRIVIWFKGNDVKKTPIYTFDARDSPDLEDSKHWADESVLDQRAYFRYQDQPANLTLDSVRESDAGIYHCRVDFQKTPTRNIKVNLTIIIPPDKLSVLDESGNHIPNYVLGPYNQGSSINITCEASGGRPPPKVTWWQENALLDESYEQISEKKVRNVLHIDKLERKHLHAVFTCQAANNHLVNPISSAVTLDINLGPLWVKLLDDNKPLSAGKKTELSCEVVGSRPKPTITWWKGSTQMMTTEERTSADRNVTTSVLKFVPTVEDGGKFLSCRGQQPNMPSTALEDGWKLDIHHVPLVSLELGSTLNGSTIKEGVDVYFECNIKSNPWVYKVSWRHNGKQLHNNIQENTIVSNQSLVLQSITRARSGFYTCVGHNQEGDGESNPVQLDVKFVPVCRPGQPKVFGVARMETVRIACELEGNPTDIQFTWKFNNSAITLDIPQEQISTEKARSVVSYKPANEQDYGTLLCWGRNEIGMQKEPCVFYINPAGKPDPPSNCSIMNQTSDSVYVECSEGFNGGLHQSFTMEVFDSQSRKLITNITTSNPIFIANGLDSGINYDIGVYAWNRKGRSGVVHLNAFTLKSAEKHTVKNLKPVPPENCTLTHQTRYYLRVRCRVREKDLHTSYLMQIYDARTRILVGTTTSQDEEDITATNLSFEREDLLLFIRTMDSRSLTSDPVVVYAPKPRDGASTPVLLQITPLLGALIGVVAALILVAIIIVVVIRLRGGGERDDKDYDDGGLSSTGRRCVAVGGGDKASTEPLNKDLNDSIDSLEEKNPDIIPQNNGDDEYQDEERAFERLNNSSVRVYSRLQSPGMQHKNGAYEGFPKAGDDITYAELSIANQQMPHVIYNQAIPMAVMRRQEPTVYAQLDMKRMPHMQPLSPPHPSFHTLQHPHLPAYMQRPLREELHDSSINAETPLISSRDTVMQSLLEGNRTPTITATLPRSTATRF